MRPRLREVVQRMVDEGTFSSDDAATLRRSMAQAAGHDGSAPWYVRLIAAFGAWVAAALLALFLFATELFKSGGAMIGLGLVLVAAACAARAKVRNDFAVQASLAGMVAGEALALFGVLDSWKPSNVEMGLIAVALNAVVVVALADPVGRFLASSFAVASTLVVVNDLGQPGPLVGLPWLLQAGAMAVWLVPPSWGGERWQAIRRPLGVALVAGFLGSLAFNLEELPRRAQSAATFIAAAAGVTALAVLLVAWILRAHRVSLRSEAGAVAIAVAVLLGAVGWRTPGILGAAAMLAMGYHRREVVLVGLATASFAGFAGWYYYSLEATLLAKAGALILSGAVALGAREYLRRRRPASPPRAEGAAA